MADRAFDWNDTIENDSSFTLLPEGDYPFTVLKFERGEHAGSDGIPPCKKAVLTIELDGGALGTTEIIENLFLHSRMEWKLCQFFTAIGQRQRGEQLRMDWTKVPGAQGMARVIVNEYDEKKNGQKTGNKRKNNRVEQFLEPVQGAGNGFTPGAF